MESVFQLGTENNLYTRVYKFCIQGVHCVQGPHVQDLFQLGTEPTSRPVDSATTVFRAVSPVYLTTWNTAHKYIQT